MDCEMDDQSSCFYCIVCGLVELGRDNKRSPKTPTWPPVVIPHMGWFSSFCLGCCVPSRRLLTPRPRRVAGTTSGICRAGAGGTSCLPAITLWSNLDFSCLKSKIVYMSSCMCLFNFNFALLNLTSIYKNLI